jgi:putative transposase
LTRLIAETLKEEIQKLCTEQGAEVLELEVMPDHVHLLVGMPPKLSVSQLVHRLKGSTSRKLRLKYPWLQKGKHLWSPSFFVSSVGGAPLDVVKRYLENQKE